LLEYIIIIFRSKEKRSSDSTTRRRSRSRNKTISENSSSSSSAAEHQGAAAGGPFSLPSFSHSSGHFDSAATSTAAARRQRAQRQLKKSSSLTDFNHETAMASSETATAWPPRSLSSFQLPLAVALDRPGPGSGPSSSSSGGTGTGHYSHAGGIAAHLPLNHGEEEGSAPPPSRYSSRRSISNSFETVVGADRVAGLSSGKESLGKSSPRPPVLGIRFRMFLGLPDPDPDPSLF